MKYIVGLLVLSIVANLYFSWGTEDALGWIVALAGWLGHMFPDRKAAHGDS